MKWILKVSFLQTLSGFVSNNMHTAKQLPGISPDSCFAYEFILIQAA